MRNNAKQAYVTPEFIHNEVVIERNLCASPEDPVTEENDIRVSTEQQAGWNENKDSYGFVSNDWNPSNS